MKRAFLAVLVALAPAIAGAEVKSAAPDAMLIELRYTIAAPAAKVWESLVHPERWWPADHTWSGKRENLSLSAEVGGCFCERWEGGSVEHGRVIMVDAEQDAAHGRRTRSVAGNGGLRRHLGRARGEGGRDQRDRDAPRER